MRESFGLLFLLPSLAWGSLEVISSDFISRQPDGLGPVIDADLDGDGDRDLIVIGARNDFAGWIEATAGGPLGPLRRLETEDIPLAGKRPMIARLHGGDLPDIHFPGWRIPNLFRKFGPPEPYPASENHDLLAGLDTLMAGRSTLTGEWTLFTPEGAAPISTPSGILRSDTSPAAGLTHLGDLNQDGLADLIVVLDGAQIGTGPVLEGLYLFPATEDGFAEPIRLLPWHPVYGNPRLLQPIRQSFDRLRLTGLVYGSNVGPQDDPTAEPQRCWISSLHWTGQGFQPWTTTGQAITPTKAVSLTVLPSSVIFDTQFWVRCSNTDRRDFELLQRYRTRPSYIGSAELVSEDHLMEPGTGEVFPLPFFPYQDVVFATFRPASNLGISGADTIRSIHPADRHPYSQGPHRAKGTLTHGPLGILATAEWHDLDGDGSEELLAATGRSESLIIFDPDENPVRRVLSPPPHPFNSEFFISDYVPPFVLDYDEDGDLDILHSSESGIPFMFENLGDTYGLSQHHIAISYYGEIPIRLDRKTVIYSSGPDSFIFPNTLWMLSLDPYDPYSGYPAPIAYPGTGARVVAANHDIDGDGHPDFVFFPSVYGNALAWGKWNPGGRHLDSLDFVASYPPGFDISDLRAGDLDGDGVPDLFHPHPEGNQVTWAAARLSGGSLTAFDHPSMELPAPPTWVLPVDLDHDGDIDLIRLEAPGGPPSEAIPHVIRWSEFIGGTWIHHTTELGSLRTSTNAPRPVWKSETTADGARLLLFNRIGEVLQIRTRTTPPPEPLSQLLAIHGATGASADPHGDPDGDGIPNFAEIVAGTSPLVSNPGFSVPLLPSSEGEDQGWIATVPVCLETCGIGARLETSDDLVSWHRHDASPLALGEQDEAHRYLFRDTALSPSPLRRFARIVFSHP